MSSSMLEWMRQTPLSEVVPGVWYPGHMDGLPDLYVGRLPPALMLRNNDSAVNNAYRITFVENDVDRRLVEQSLRLPLTVTASGVDFRPTIDRVNLKPSTMPPCETTCALYVPPISGWPWFIVVKVSVNIRGQELCRMRYGTDGFATEDEAQGRMVRMAALTRASGSEAPIITPDHSRMS